MAKKQKTSKQMERHLKGLANHYRLDILLFVDAQPGCSLLEIVEAVGANDKTVGEHSRRLAAAGLINKKYRGNFVEHQLSPYGQEFVKFIKKFQDM